MIKEEYKFSDETYKIIGLAMEVHKELGSGFQEVIYQRALEIELSNNNIEYKREFNMPVMFKGMQIGERRVDFLINEKISIEIKAASNLEPVHLAQAKNYLEVYHLEIGLLINFGAESLQVKRLINNKLSDPKYLNNMKKKMNLDIADK